jgi:hypothetical protein
MCPTEKRGNLTSPVVASTKQYFAIAPPHCPSDILGFERDRNDLKN